ncbi:MULTISPECIES: helix-hairpin-helix domain-containing protein [unclassified Virgibacillus]|uniref:helix-hairpin-helix domain-containing protein n=1 Tax=unclassified Virgibacillus TaxID=2620237 RepID=UPI0024DE15DF|nr:helix-hairpin-helix domain-containing protein [Virgibacillus sp. LDC-1]
MLSIGKKLLFPIIIIVLILLFIILTKEDHAQLAEQPIDSNLPSINDPEKEDAQSVTVLIDVKGHVQKPGVYELTSSARVKDVIDLAGGFTDKADQTSINLAQKVNDEMVIIVPELGSPDDSDNGATTGSKAGNKLAINRATKEEIEQLNGIGPKKAEAIIQYREEHGQFRKLEDLLEVSGIGEKTLESIKDAIQIP